jgi:hypothetical protein
MLFACNLSLDKRYHAACVAGEALETRLRIYFSTEKPRLLWHATMDLLTVRYFQLIDLANVRLLQANAGPKHSGLTVEELKNPKLVLVTYRNRLVEATSAVLTEPRRIERRGMEKAVLAGGPDTGHDDNGALRSA